MGILTVKLKDRDEAAVELVKSKHHINTKTKALIFCLHNQSRLENEIEQLQQERILLLNKIANYQENSAKLLSGISGLRELTDL